MQHLRHLGFIAFIGVFLLSSSCKKEALPETELPSAPAELTFEKWVLLEPTVSTSCGACPLMHHEVEQLVGTNDRVLHMNHYTTGPMFHPFTAYILNDVDKTVFTPLAHINRRFEDGSMVYYRVPSVAGLVETELDIPARYALQVDPQEGPEGMEVAVTIMPKDQSDLGDFMLHLFIVEKEVSEIGPGYDQRNYGNDDPEHPFYGQGNWIEGFVHTNVIRGQLTEKPGDLIDLSASEPTTFQYVVDRELLQNRPQDFAIIAAISEPGERLQPFLNAAYSSF